MRCFLISVAHMRSEIVAWSMDKVFGTVGIPFDRKILVDNLWPLDVVKTSAHLEQIAVTHGMELIRAEKNEGGAGGFNLGLKALGELQDNDLIYGVDPDSNPITLNWGLAMYQAHELHPYLDAVHLMHEHIVERPWRINFGPPMLAKLPHPEMQNVTSWKYRALKDGLKSGRPFYGFNELAMKIDSAYLHSYREDLCPVPHDPRYIDWKRKHAFENLNLNFDEYLKTLGDL